MKTKLLSIILCVFFFASDLSAQAPTISSFTPTSAGIGQTVTIAGTNFTDVSQVTIGGVAVGGFTQDSNSQITISLGSGATGDVSVTTPSGTAILSGFTFTPPVTTQIKAAQCGTTISAINTLIAAVCIPQATGYRFEITNTSTSTVQILERALNYFSLTMLASYDYATTYSIRVEVQKNGIWQGSFGSSCMVSSPAILAPDGAAQLTPSQCDSTFESINTLIATTSLAGVTGYRFRVTNMTDIDAPNQVQIIDRKMSWFGLTMLETYNYGTAYIIEVAVKTNGDYTDFGAPCQIRTPAVPELDNCGATIPDPAILISVRSLAKVTAYRYEITNLDTYMVTTIDRAQNWFTFNQVPSYSPASQYGVRVALMTSGSFSLFGEACELRSPDISRVSETKTDKFISFTATAYPNPFSESFSIDLTASSDEKNIIKAYDMTGRLLEMKEVSSAEIQNQEFGQNYQSGVYNIVISQGNNVRTLRIIKR